MAAKREAMHETKIKRKEDMKSWVCSFNEVFALENNFFYVRFEVLTAVDIKAAIFRDIAPCSPCMNQRFGGTYYLHLHSKTFLSET
jgi:hypothetical protein